MYAESVEQENVTVTPATEFEFTTRTNRTNRLELLEEYYHNATDENQIENKTGMEIKEIVVLSANVSANDDADRTNVTIVEQIGKKKRNLKYNMDRSKILGLIILRN